MSLFRRLAFAAISCAGLLGASSLSFRSTDLPWAAVGADYRATIETQGDGRCALGDIALVIVGGVLPDGLRLQGDSIGGVPKQMGIFRFRIRAANNCASAEREYQMQVTGKPVLRVSPEELGFEYKLGEPAPATKNVLVSSTWPELPYSVTGAANWLRVNLRAGVTPFPGSAFSGDAATVEVVPRDLKPGVYQATLVFCARQGSNPVAVPVRLKVSAPIVAAAQTVK